MGSEMCIRDRPSACKADALPAELCSQAGNAASLERVERGDEIYNTRTRKICQLFFENFTKQNQARRDHAHFFLHGIEKTGAFQHPPDYHAFLNLMQILPHTQSFLTVKTNPDTKTNSENKFETRLEKSASSRFYLVPRSGKLAQIYSQPMSSSQRFSLYSFIAYGFTFFRCSTLAS